MEKEIRNQRITKKGVVVSAGKMNKTIVVSVVENKKHPLYKKVVKVTKKYKVHDEENVCGMGDTIEIMETRPLSKDKYNRLLRIVEKAK
jgi:small subunit ribosomal protein S17